MRVIVETSKIGKFYSNLLLRIFCAGQGNYIAGAELSGLEEIRIEDNTPSGTRYMFRVVIQLDCECS